MDDAEYLKEMTYTHRHKHICDLVSVWLATCALVLMSGKANPRQSSQRLPKLTVSLLVCCFTATLWLPHCLEDPRNHSHPFTVVIYSAFLIETSWVTAEFEAAAKCCQVQQDLPKASQVLYCRSNHGMGHCATYCNTAAKLARMI